MNNLFSIFDPHSSLGLSLNWIVSLFVLTLTPSLFWIRKTQLVILWNKRLNYVYLEFYAITGPIITPGGLWLSISLFTYILLINITGLFPYIFPSTRHLTLSVSLALPLWLGHIIIRWLKQPNFILAHLVPNGTPTPLLPFMVLIELIRRLIRPLTLSVRLAANIVAGHLILTLLRSLGRHVNVIILRVLLISLITLRLLERGVAIIQAYVFRVLSTLYIREVVSKNINK